MGAKSPDFALYTALPRLWRRTMGAKSPDFAFYTAFPA